jgi:hypothetical protein
MAGEKIIAKIKNNEFSRAELARIRINSMAKYNNGDDSAKKILDLIDLSKPIDEYILFMGFCPNADFENRLDLEWKEKGICRFDWEESEVQTNRFYEICAGDLVVLKKREKFGKTMNLYGFGRVNQIAHDEDNVRYFIMDWDKQDEIIEVPLMGCNSTVDVKSMENVEKQMPQEFFDWLKK